ncbi:MAG: hypothetical protein M1381_06710 [Deltaproteobacteria bacterium]|nr:hypothetical protein [Deltaproteobacteria bacterium]MCL5792952.1 hypothetical protein [Deltaproteobacteria bacterium]
MGVSLNIYHKVRWLTIILFIGYSLFNLSGCTSCSKRSSSSTPPPPVYIDSFTTTSGGRVTDTGYTPATFTFTVTAHSKASIVSYKWSFIDDQYGNPQFIATTTSPTAVYTYTQPTPNGTYNIITVRVTNNKGVYKDANASITVNQWTPPTLALMPSTLLNQQIPFSIIIQADAYPSSGATITECEWDFGNGQGFSVTQTTSLLPGHFHQLGEFTYFTVGTYPIIAKVIDSAGFTATAYLTATAEVSINPTSMYQLNSQGNYINFGDIGGTPYAFLSDGQAGIKVFDMSNPQSPVMVSRWYDPHSMPAEACSLLGNYLYCAFQQTVYIFDVSNPSSLQWIKAVLPPANITYKILSRALATTISGTNYLFVADAQAGTIDIFSLANFTQAAFITQVTAPYISGTGYPAPINDIFITSTTGTSPTYYAYVAADTGGFAIYNVTNPTDTTLLGVASNSSNPYLSINNAVGVWMTDTNYAYVADSSNGAVLVDIKAPSHPVAIASYPASATGIWVTGTTVYLAATSGLYLCPVSFGLIPSISCGSPIQLTFSSFSPIQASNVYGGMISGSLYAFVPQLYGFDTFTTTNSSLPSHTSFYQTYGHGNSVIATDTGSMYPGLAGLGFSYIAFITNSFQQGFSFSGGGIDIVGYNQGFTQPDFLSRITTNTNPYGVAITSTSFTGTSYTVSTIAAGSVVDLADMSNPASPYWLPGSWDDAVNVSSNQCASPFYDKIYLTDPQHFIVGDNSECGGYYVTMPAAFITPTTTYYNIYGIPNTKGDTGQDMCLLNNTVFIAGNLYGTNETVLNAYPLTANMVISQFNFGSTGSAPSLFCEDSGRIFIAMGASVTSINYSNLNAPQIISTFTPSSNTILTSFTVVDNIGFAGYSNVVNSPAEGGFYVLDLRNPSNMLLIGSMDYNILSLDPDYSFISDDYLIPNSIYAIKGTDGYYYVLLLTPNRVITFQIYGAP